MVKQVSIKFLLTVICLLLQFCFLIQLSANPITLSGKILSPEGDVPFAHIYLEGTTKGTVANESGEFSFSVPAGIHSLVVRAIGYDTHKEELKALGDVRNIEIMLQSRTVSLEEVVVTGAEDPAYGIMRQVIAHREKHHNAVEGFSCRAYLKGLNRIVKAPDEIFGIPVNFSGMLDSNNTGIIYLSESESEFHFKQPDRVREIMHASKVSGDTRAFSWNMASDFLFTLYQNRIEQDVLTRRGIISPLADNAFFYYKYSLQNITNEDGIMVYHIDFEPRRRNDPAMTGSIQVNHDLWNLREADIFLFKENGLNYVDTLHIKQSFVPVKENIWLPMAQLFEFRFEIFGIEVEGYFTGVYTNYELNPEFPKGFFTNEILNITDEANTRDEGFWKLLRPIPLTDEEVRDYEVKDSLEILRQTREFQDSLDREYNRFRPWNIVLGYRYRNSYKNTRLWLSPIINQVQFNTIEGLRIQQGINFRQSTEENLFHEFSVNLRYGTASNNFYGNTAYTYAFNRYNQGRLTVEGGHFLYQYNRSNPISPLINTFYSLALKENYKKIYEESYANMRWRQEIFNGGMLRLSGGFARRKSIKNHTNYSWNKNKDKVYTPNMIQPIQENNMFAVQNSDIFFLESSLRLRFKQTYITRPDMKIITGYKGPQLYLRNKTAFPALNTINTGFTRFEVELAQQFSMGLVGTASYNLIGGNTYVWDKISLFDLKHFNGNQTLFANDYNKSFFLLNYYNYSTSNSYAQLHFSHHFDGFIINKIPLLRRTRLAILYGVNILAVKDLPVYYETHIGLKNIFRIARVDYALGYKSDANLIHGVRIGINLGQL